jgi:hypothetical protein
LRVVLVLGQKQPEESVSMEATSENDRPNKSGLKSILLVGTMSISLLSLNFFGLYTLLGTVPSDKLAPIFVLGVGAFFSQFVLLGMVAGFLPYSLPRRLATPSLVVLAIYLECKSFEQQASPRTLEVGIAYLVVLGFLVSAVSFSGMRAVFGFRLQRVCEVAGQSHESFRHFGIVDILTITAAVAVVLNLVRLDGLPMEVSLPIIIASLIIFPVLALLFGPLHLFAICDKARIQNYVFGLVLVVFLLPAVLMFLAESFGGRRDTAPYLFCLSLGCEAAWLIWLRCIRLLGFRVVRRTAGSKVP